MSGWHTPSEKTIYGVSIYNFWNESNEKYLKLNVGDTVHILKECEDWYFGYNTKKRLTRGVFPKSFVHIKEAVVNHNGVYESVSPKDSSLVLEITSTLREWGVLWKELYIHSTRTKISNFEMIWKMMGELINWRATIMSHKLTVDELKDLQHKVTRTMDMGNAYLGLDLVVRDSSGNITDALQTCTIDLYRQHEVVARRVQAERNSLHRHGKQKRQTSFNLFVYVKNFVCRTGEDADVYMTLYDAKQAEFISENYYMGWTSQGMPRDIEMFNNLRVLFTDLGLKDAEREKVYLVCQVIRIGRMDLKDNDTKKQTKGIRRPFGVAAIDVTDIFIGKFELDTDKQMFIPFQHCGEKDHLDSLLKKVVVAKEVNHKGQGLWVTLKKIPGDIHQAQKEYAHLLAGSAAIARKMGFPDVIMPGDVRNDIYITLCTGEFRRGSKTSEKNVEVTLCVCDGKGQVLENAISDGAGGKQQTYYRSVIYYHEDKPKWYETIKVAIPFEDFHGAHLKFMFKHRSSSEAKDNKRPFALAFVKLMQEDGTTLPDSLHELLVYRIDPKRTEEGCLYLTLPSTRQELSARTQGSNPLPKPSITAGSLTLSNNDIFDISTLVCSTKLTHDVNLMGLLKWRDNHSNLKQYLLDLTRVDGEEVVKFLQDVLDALYNILMQNSQCEEYDKLVFDALIFLIGLVSNPKYSQFRPVLDVYIQENFSATLAYYKLLDVLKDYIDAQKTVAIAEQLHKTFKSIDYLFKFIVRSRVLFAAISGKDDKQQFESQLQQVFASINVMMKDRTGILIPIQEAALKYIPTTVSDIITIFSRVEFSNVLIEFIESIPRDRFIKQKIQCMNDIIHSQLFLYGDCRAILLPPFMDQTQSLLQSMSELEHCAALISDILEATYRDDIGNTRDDISCIVLSVLRTVIQTVIQMDRDSPNIGIFVSIMTSILRQMSEYHYMRYIDHFPTIVDLTDFLMEILMVFRDLVTNNVYPCDWNEMIMLQNSVFLSALRYFSNTIQEKFSEPFHYQLWNNFFLCAIAFLTQDALQLEEFSSLKRNKIISRYKDMRREMGFEIRAMWFNLGQNKRQFIPELVGPILEMTLIPEVELRKATIPLFFDMMYCEFMSQNSSGVHKKPNFNQFESEIISQLDSLLEEGQGDEQYKELFYEIMMEKCSNLDVMKKDGVAFVNTVYDMIDRLLEYRDIIDDESKENRMTCTMNILEFYQDVKRQELYIRYLLKLKDLHLECDNYTEAGYTLMEFTKLLKWSNDPLPTILRMNTKYEDVYTQRDLLEKLYYDIIDYLDKGKMWETGIELCKTLADQYENETFDYIQLSEILKMQAEFYDKIMNTERAEPQYFRVGYYGVQFPKFVRNRVYIYRGDEYEKLPDFTSRLFNQFPNAILMKTLDTPGDDIKQSRKQYLQINAVSPIMQNKPKFLRGHVHDQILKHYRFNQVNTFSFERQLHDSSGPDVTKMWLKRTVMTITDPLPGILRWFVVKDCRTYEVSPLEYAVETLEDKNQKLRAMIDQHRLHDNLEVKSLNLLLLGMVDAAVSGGLPNYKIFYSEEFEKDMVDTGDRFLIQRLRHITTLQMVLLQTALDIHGEKAPDDMKPLQAHMEEKFEELKQYIEAEFHIQLSEEKKAQMSATYCPVIRRKARPIQHRHTVSNNTRHTTNTRHTQSVSFNHHGPSPRASHAINHLGPSPRASHAPSTITMRESSASQSSSQRGFSKVMSSIGMSATSSMSSLAPSHNANEELSSNTSMSTSRSRTDSVVYELNEQLTPARPPRPDIRRSRSKSSEFKAYQLSRKSIETSSASSSNSLNSSNNVTNDDDAPPPLPVKSIYSDYTNLLDPHQSITHRHRGGGGDVTRKSHITRHTMTVPEQGESTDGVSEDSGTATSSGTITRYTLTSDNVNDLQF